MCPTLISAEFEPVLSHNEKSSLFTDFFSEKQTIHTSFVDPRSQRPFRAIKIEKYLSTEEEEVILFIIIGGVQCSPIYRSLSYPLRSLKVSLREGGDIGLFITLVPKVF